MTMALLRTSLLILATLTEFKFLIYRNPQVREAFVCFNENNSSWPDNWLRLEPSFQDGIPVFQSTNLPKNNTIILKYKLNFFYPNRTYGESQWKSVLNNTFAENNKTGNLYETDSHNDYNTPNLIHHYNINTFFVFLTITNILQVLQVVIFIRSTCILNPINFIRSKVGERH